MILIINHRKLRNLKVSMANSWINMKVIRMIKAKKEKDFVSATRRLFISLSMLFSIYFYSDRGYR